MSVPDHSASIRIDRPNFKLFINYFPPEEEESEKRNGGAEKRHEEGDDREECMKGERMSGEKQVIEDVMALVVGVLVVVVVEDVV